MTLYHKDIVTKFSFLCHPPEGGCQEADLLLIVQDVSNRYVREAIDKKVLRLLCLFNHVPAVLVLNKMGRYC